MKTSIQTVEKTRRLLHRFEDYLLVGLLSLLIGTAVLQIALRNLFGSGIAWGDILVRMLVLWVGLVGAMLASRTDNHIRIDLATRYLPEKAIPAVNCQVGLFTAGVCGILGYYGYRFVEMEFMGGTAAFAQVPVWLCAAVIPFVFSIIALRYLLSAVSYLIHMIRSAS